jgi:hypothetical protein
MKESLQQAGMRVVEVILDHNGEREVILSPIGEPHIKEHWIKNDGHASYGIKIYGKDYEFVSSYHSAAKGFNK